LSLILKQALIVVILVGR